MQSVVIVLAIIGSLDRPAFSPDEVAFPRVGRRAMARDEPPPAARSDCSRDEQLQRVVLLGDSSLDDLLRLLAENLGL